MSLTRKPFITENIKATAALKVGQPVDFNGGLAAAGAPILGFAAYDAAVGDFIAVDVAGHLGAWSGAAISFGQRVKPDGLGGVIPAAAGDVACGYALSAPIGANLPVRVLRLSVTC